MSKFQTELLEILAVLQHDVEAGQDDHAKRRRRLLLRGARAMVNVLHMTTPDNIEERLRDELWDIPPLGHDKRVGSGG